MFRKSLLLVAALVCTAPVFASDPCVAAIQSPPPLEDHPSGQHTFARAGHALNVAWYARPSDTGAYIGYDVGGGGCGWKGQCRLLWEGTWGWDYSGRCFRRWVVLGWCHGRRYQEGI